MQGGGAPDARPAGGASLGARDLLLLTLGFGALGLLVYRAALHGPFVSDDPFYYYNPFVRELSLENLLAILDPRGIAHHYQYNYAPLHLLWIALQVQLFGSAMLGYHLLNLALHVAGSVLLVALLMSSGVPRTAAILGGAIFALHPANVEAVAWISQLKSVGALAFGLAAVLALERHPRGSVVLFALALLTKFSAVAFLPMAAALAWARRSPRRTWLSLAAWLAVLAGVSSAQLPVFAGGGGYELPAFEDHGQQLRTIAAIGARYLWMAATGLGLSAYHEPEPSPSWADPLCWTGLGLGALLAGRVVAGLRRRDEEVAWWIGAAAAFVPISQLAPFRFPMADRYLHFILPGLIGGTLLAGLAARRRPGATPGWGWIDRALVAGGAALALLFAFQATSRAPVWADGRNLLVDAARHYPDGSHAHYLRAVQAAQRRDAEGAVAELRVAEERKRLSLVRDFANDPLLAPIHAAPAFREFVRETARFRIELVQRRGLRRGEELVLAMQHAALGEFGAAIELVEQALRQDDSRRDELLAVLEDLRARQRGIEPSVRPER